MNQLGHSKNISNLVEWISLSFSGRPFEITEKYEFKTETLKDFSNEFYCSDESKIAILVNTKHWGSIQNLQNLDLRLDQYIRSFDRTLRKSGATEQVIQNSEQLCKVLSKKEFSNQLMQKGLSFDLCTNEIEYVLSQCEAIQDQVISRNFILLSLDLAETIENFPLKGTKFDENVFEKIKKRTEAVLRKSLNYNSSKNFPVSFWIKISTKRHKVNSITSIFCNEKAQEVINFVCDCRDARNALKKLSDNNEFKSSLLWLVFEKPELNDIADELGIRDPAFFDNSNTCHRLACDEVFGELLKMFENFPVNSSPFETVCKAGEWKHLGRLLAAYPQLKPRDNCQNLMRVIVDAHLNALKDIRKQSISTENLKKIEENWENFVSVCNKLQRWDTSELTAAFPGMLAIQKFQ